MVHEQPLSGLKLMDILSQRVSPSQAAVAGIPMSNMSREKRGKRIQEIGFAIDRRLHSRCEFGYTKGNRGLSNAPADWMRANERVELKSCGLTFSRSRNRWQCEFQHIKPDLFDELWLAIYTSVGIHFCRSQWCRGLGFCKAGVATEIRGHTLVFCGPKGELDPLAALKTIQAKMISRGCELFAIVEWEKGGSMPHASLGGDEQALKRERLPCMESWCRSSRVDSTPLI